MRVDRECFGPAVATVSLADDWLMDLRPVDPFRDGAESILLERGSALVLTREARQSWLHGIARDSSAARSAQADRPDTRYGPERRPVAAKMQPRGSAERLDGAAGWERRPPVGTRRAAAQRTARRRPARWFSPGATGRRGRSRTSVAQDDERRGDHCGRFFRFAVLVSGPRDGARWRREFRGRWPRCRSEDRRSLVAPVRSPGAVRDGSGGTSRSARCGRRARRSRS